MGEGLEVQHVRERGSLPWTNTVELTTWVCNVCRTPQLNLQFTVHTSDGLVRDYFSKRMESHGDWQHVAVAYNAAGADVQFYINGFPAGLDAAPKVGKVTRSQCVDAQST